MSWVDRIAAWVYRRGQSIVDARDQSLEERRQAVRAVRDAIADAMTDAERDREHGDPRALRAARAKAGEAASVVQEVDDEQSRQLVTEWRAAFDGIEKGWKESSPRDSRAPGYPEPAWSELRSRADLAQARLGEVLRALLADQA